MRCLDIYMLEHVQPDWNRSHAKIGVRSTPKYDP